MSKYNHGSSIPIENLSKEELQIAMKEWAEGSDSLEKLLWALYNKGLETSGCHAGQSPYIEFKYNPNKKDLLIKMMNSIISSKDTQIFIAPNGGNPFSGPDWYKPYIILGSNLANKNDVDKEFEEMTKIINDEIKIPTFINTSHLLDLLEFFMKVEKDFKLRLIHTPEDDIIFSIESRFTSKDSNYEQINRILTKIGLTLEEIPDGYASSWILSTNDPTEWADKIKECIKEITNNYIPVNISNVEEAGSFNEKARIVRKKSLEETGNEEMFKSWLSKEWDKMRANRR